MDVARIALVLTLATLGSGWNSALAQSSNSWPQQRASNVAGQSDWSSAGPTSVPSISANPADRYGYQQSTTGAQPSLTQRTQNAVNSTANSLRDGFNAGVHTVSQQFSGNPSQPTNPFGNPSQPTTSFGNPQQPATSFGSSASYGNQSQSSNPFAVQPTTPVPNTNTRGGVAPPSYWPGSSSAASTTATTAAPAPGTGAGANWFDTSSSAAPQERSMLNNTSTSQPPASQPPSGWSTISSTTSAPPLNVPAPNTSNNYGAASSNPFNNQTSNSGNIYNTASQSTAPQTHSTPNNDDWTQSWDTNTNPQASIGRGSPPTSPFNSTAPASTAHQESRKQNSNHTDGWPDSSGPSLNNNNPTIASAPVAKSGPFNAPNTSPSFGPQPSVNTQFPTAPQNNPSFGNTNYNNGYGGLNPTKPNESVPGQTQAWVPLLAAVLSLAGSLAGNLFLGWSYLDAREKYQSLVRRTADTFRRVKTAAA